MADVRVKLTTEAELAPLVDAAGRLKLINEVTQDLNRTFKDARDSAAAFADTLSARQAQAAETNRSLTAEQDRVSKSARESAEAMLAAKEPTHQLSLKNAELRAGLRQLATQFPLLGLAIRDIDSAYIGSGLAIAQFISHVSGSQKEFDGMARKSQELSLAFDPLLTKLISIEQQAAQTKNAFGELAEKITDVTNRARGLDEALSRSLTIEDQALRVAQAKLGAEKQKRLAGVTNESVRAAIEAEFEGRSLDLATVAAGKKAQITEQASLRARAQAEAAERALPAEQEKLDEMEARAKQRSAEQTALLSELPKLKENLRQVEDKASAYDRFLHTLTFGLGGRTTTEEIEALPPAQDIRENILRLKEAEDRFAARSLLDQAAISRQRRVVGRLSEKIVGGPRFAAQTFQAQSEAAAVGQIGLAGAEAAFYKAEGEYIKELVERAKKEQREEKQVLKEALQEILGGQRVHKADLDGLKKQFRALQGQ